MSYDVERDIEIYKLRNINTRAAPVLCLKLNW